jgi:hypothetical protein
MAISSNATGFPERHLRQVGPSLVPLNDRCHFHTFRCQGPPGHTYHHGQCRRRPHTVSLSGTGAHDVILSWTASAVPWVMGL